MNIRSHLSSSILHYSALFLLKIGLFAAIYFGVFKAYPDAFRFSDGYNVNPLSSYWVEFYETEDLSGVATSGVSADVEVVREQAQLAQAVYSIWQAAAVTRLTKGAEFQMILMELNRHRDVALEEFKQTEIEPLERRILESERAMGATDPSDPKFSIMTELHESLLQELEQKWESVMQDGFALVDPSLSERVLLVERELDEAEKTEIELSQKYSQERVKLSDIYSKARNEILSKVNFFDFLYFSACVSTTTTFGDITANLRWLRLVVAFQIVLGILILAKMLDVIVNGHYSRRSGT